MKNKEEAPITLHCVKLWFPRKIAKAWTKDREESNIEKKRGRIPIYRRSTKWGENLGIQRGGTEEELLHLRSTHLGQGPSGKGLKNATGNTIRPSKERRRYLLFRL